MQKNKRFIFSFLFLLLTSPTLFGCKWCDKWQKNEPQADAKKENNHLDPRLRGDDIRRRRDDTMDNKNKNQSFYKEYLKKYYPKALIINDYFVEMCPKAVDAALKEVLNVLSNEEWFYYQDKPKDFKAGEYWEITLEQCAKIKNFLETAFINENNQIVVFAQNFNYGEAMEESYGMEKLLDFFKKNGFTAYQYFYAEYADRLTKMVNEGIKNTDLIKAHFFHNCLCKTLENLRNFPHYNMYEEVVKKQKGLLAILKNKLNIPYNINLPKNPCYKG